MSDIICPVCKNILLKNGSTYKCEKNCSKSKYLLNHDLEFKIINTLTNRTR